MPLARKCEACGEFIAGLYVYLPVKICRTYYPAGQHVQGQVYGVYCQRCVLSGAAMNDLLSGLTIKLAESPAQERA